jgi:putative tryptophan/tyrosine transport system substrate-binding protein
VVRSVADWAYENLMQRRTFLSLLGATVATPSLPLEAQQAVKPTRIARIGYVSTDLTASPHLPEAFRRGLRDLGYVEGRNVTIEWRSAEGNLDRFPALAAELIALKVDIIVAANTRAALAAKQATTTLPIIFAGPADPVASGLVANLARPGGNVTGLSSLAPELVGKDLELLKEAAPAVSRVAVLWHRDFDENTQQIILREAEAAGRTLGVQLHFAEAGDREHFDTVFGEITAARVEALIVLPSVLFVSSRRPVVELAAQSRLPAVYPTRDFVDEGGLMSYGALWADIYRRAAGYVDKILKGAKPADLPVQRPTKFELVINLKTAKALGLTVPLTLLARADEVIE